ncbi:MAG: DNA polymerase III, subunit gamma and tau [Candidatus Lambdaproteobacteria bacterium RIFOXYD2_FULL_50_16]|uniref:DNA polymerase III subunit gamma/tau n=1 Tax=Candidatus Lambdaproteobacteria bacterium RIFOXYD2_FULL_50_16 TaxID=1817772 RepID=A0A1F6GBR7_9PROT|nr:MAG: DNA polymerase III, subunit gamma and tau [Candidatus Lambdaproteobacteria bacterium RIFOXYD2_FULL_50_16]
MSYVVLARKLRPQRFQDLVGQEAIHQTLINAIKTNRVAHAFLFTGPRGTGKTSCARILTKALNCAHPIEFEPCNTCESCLEIGQGISADVMEIDAASNRGIEHIRELRESVKFSPSKGNYKTYIIDEVHMLTTESFNALLKTLEEPPSHVKFILATTDPHKIPTTVISRCQRFDFSFIPINKIAGYLNEVAQLEGIGISEKSLNLIARASVGGMRDALTQLDMLVSFSGNQIGDEAVINLLGLGGAEDLDRLLEALCSRDLSSALACFDRQMKRGRSLDKFLTELMTAIKDLSLVKELPAEKLGWREFLPEQLILYKRLAAKVTGPQLQQMFGILLEIETQTKRSAQSRLCLEMGLVKLCGLEQIRGIGEILGLLKGAKANPQPFIVAPALGEPKVRVQEETQASEEVAPIPPAPEPLAQVLPEAAPVPPVSLTLPEPLVETRAQFEPPALEEAPAQIETPVLVDSASLAPKLAEPIAAPAIAPYAAYQREQEADEPPLEEPPDWLDETAVEDESEESGLVSYEEPEEPEPVPLEPSPLTPPTPSFSSVLVEEEPESGIEPPPIQIPLAPPNFVAQEPWELEEDYDPSPEEMGQEVYDLEHSPESLAHDTAASPHGLPVHRPATNLWGEVASVPLPPADRGWAGFVSRFAQESSEALLGVIKTSVPLEFGEEGILLGCQNPAIWDPSKRERLEEFAARWFGKPVSFKVIGHQGHQDSLRVQELEVRKEEELAKEGRARLDPRVQAVQLTFPDAVIEKVQTKPKEN